MPSMIIIATIYLAACSLLGSLLKWPERVSLVSSCSVIPAETDLWSSVSGRVAAPRLRRPGPVSVPSHGGSERIRPSQPHNPQSSLYTTHHTHTHTFHDHKAIVHRNNQKYSKRSVRRLVIKRKNKYYYWNTLITTYCSGTPHINLMN